MNKQFLAAALLCCPLIGFAQLPIPSEYSDGGWLEVLDEVRVACQVTSSKAVFVNTRREFQDLTDMETHIQKLYPTAKEISSCWTQERFERYVATRASSGIQMSWAVKKIEKKTKPAAKAEQSNSSSDTTVKQTYSWGLDEDGFGALCNGEGKAFSVRGGAFPAIWERIPPGKSTQMNCKAGSVEKMAQMLKEMTTPAK